MITSDCKNVFAQGKRLPGIFQYTLSRRSQSNQAFTLSNDDLRAQFLFQASKVLRNCRLHQAQVISGFRDIEI